MAAPVGDENASSGRRSVSGYLAVASVVAQVGWWVLTWATGWPLSTHLVGAAVIASVAVAAIVACHPVARQELCADAGGAVPEGIRKAIHLDLARLEGYEAYAVVYQRSVLPMGHVWYAAARLPTGDVLEQSGWAPTRRWAQRAGSQSMVTRR